MLLIHLRPVPSNVEVHSLVIMSCRVRPGIKIGISGGPHFLYRLGNLRLISARPSFPIYMVTANELHRKGYTIHHSTRGGEGGTDVFCSQSEQETVSRQWVLDSGISSYSDHSAYMDVLFCY